MRTFLANKPLGIFNWHAEMCQKLVILCSETSKFWGQNGHFSTRKVLNALLKLDNAILFIPMLILRP